MEIIEGNKLIGVFFGDESTVNPSYFKFDNIDEWVRDSDGDYTQTWFQAKDFRFHESWEWLMPVAEKISDMPGIQMHISGRNGTYGTYRTTISVEYGCVYDKPFIEEKLITSTWQAVVSFIQWYNQNKTS